MTNQDPFVIPEVVLEASEASLAKANVPKFDYGIHDSQLGRRHKIGGKPDWIQQEEWQSCENCLAPMSFYAQLDTISPEVDIGDAGLIYVFLCFGCKNTKSIVQCY
jgi:hypothetical protein